MQNTTAAEITESTEKVMKPSIQRLFSVISVSSVAKYAFVLSIPLCLLVYALAMPNKPAMTNKTETKIEKPNDDLHARLTPEQFYVTQEKGTEAPFTGKYWKTKDPGKYYCVVCGAELFTSDSKFDSGCGWPSFDKAASDKVVDTNVDKTHGMVRDEIICHKCGAHLGHVFNDGPTATGLRYCVNSASLDFKAKADERGK
jgi:peptide-methionine (R)-S-oxide reductase